MFTVDESTYKVQVSKGDSGVIEIRFDSEYSLTSATVIVSLKESTDDSSPLWEKKLSIDSSGNCFINIGNDDTEFDFGKYYWDVRVQFSDGYVETPMNPAVFEIVEVVGNV